MGGEKLRLLVVTPGQKGSPPRGRGKVEPQCPQNSLSGITPAWAGKSTQVGGTEVILKDHPRVGGEKHSGSCRTLTRSGSPPRGRGKDRPEKAPYPAGRDHPRVGGEKQSLNRGHGWCGGSPPRGRGKESLEIKVGGATGITPAWAGKSRCARLDAGHRRDHPRVGGEKTKKIP